MVLRTILHSSWDPNEFQYAINGSTESYPQCFSYGRQPCHLQQLLCFMSRCHPQLAGDRVHFSHEASACELPCGIWVPNYHQSLSACNSTTGDGSTVEHQPHSSPVENLWHQYWWFIWKRKGERNSDEARAARFIILVINNLRHNFLSLLNKEGEHFKNKAGLFENTSFLPADWLKLGHGC